MIYRKGKHINHQGFSRFRAGEILGLFQKKVKKLLTL